MSKPLHYYQGDNTFYPSGQERDVTSMSFRQQIIYLMQQTRDEQPRSQRISLEEDVDELNEYLLQEKIRNTLPSPSKQALRNKYIEEACKVFKLIKKSVYAERKPIKLGSNEIMVCTCKQPYRIPEGKHAGKLTIACGRTCLNRVISTECYLGSCPLGELCTNRRFQLQQHAQVYPIKTENRGWGLAAGQFIKKGTFVIQYLGEIYSIDSPIGIKRLEKYRGKECTYLMSTSHNEVIDPTKKGNLARFINHSCEPNCETQKWNVLGEICVGIFAKRDIYEDEELTFDYRFDTHKTSLTKCLCGAAKCRKYLGLIPSDYQSSEDWLKRLDKMKCSICKKSSEEDEYLVLCDGCNKGWHIYCLKPPLEEIPSGEWMCQKCTLKHKPKGEKKPKKEKSPELIEDLIKKIEPPQEILMMVEKRTLDALRNHLDDILEKDVKLFWGKCNDQGQYEVTIRGANSQYVEMFIEQLSQEVKPEVQVPDEITEIELKVEALYLKKLVKSFSNMQHKGNISYDQTLLTDDIYPLDKLTSIYISGHRQSIEGFAEEILNILDTFQTSTIYFSITEASILMRNIINFKNLLHPAEIRVSKEQVTNESPHPFYFYSRLERKVVLIGTEKEIDEACRVITAWFNQQLKGEQEHSFNFILPVKVCKYLNRYKMDIIKELNQMHAFVIPLIKFFEPLPPRKYLTVYIVGTWKQIIAAKIKIIEIADNYTENNEINKFFSFVTAQMFRHIIKNTAKFIHAMEKRFFSRNAQELEVWKYCPQRHYILGFWDVYSAELLCGEQGNEKIESFRSQVLSHLLEDADTLINLLRLSGSESQMQYLIETRWKITLEEALQFGINFFTSFNKKFEGNGKMGYVNNSLEELKNQLIDMSEDEQWEENDRFKIIDKAMREIDQDISFKSFTALPTSYGVDYDNSAPSPDVESRLSNFFTSLQQRKFIMGDENPYPQIIEPTLVNPEVRDNADIVVGCSKHSRNFLYVVFPEKARTLGIQNLR
ncbi:SETD2 [Blepharisma stoltei]|uniref:Histone-lysine N-methyltransferase n=1 Tax=Blepharisma stoltei TaxID=1481888 RepID=A0AAU9IWB6_9CILI|nr:unnamed protein product [Blepharisma stoltei]